MFWKTEFGLRGGLKSRTILVADTSWFTSFSKVRISNWLPIRHDTPPQIKSRLLGGFQKFRMIWKSEFGLRGCLKSQYVLVSETLWFTSFWKTPIQGLFNTFSRITADSNRYRTTNGSANKTITPIDSFEGYQSR